MSSSAARQRCAERTDATNKSPSEIFTRRRSNSVAVGHLYLRQRPRVHHVVLADDLVEPEEISGRRIDLVASQRPRLTERHRPPDEVENDRRIAKEIADGLGRFDAAGERCAAEQRRRGERTPFSAFTVAR